MIVANWKLNGSTNLVEHYLKALARFSAAVSKIPCIIAPPIPYLHQLSGRCSPALLAAQSVSVYDHGAYTGEVSAAMLKELGCVYVIVGHSERRQLFGDTDQSVALQVKAALEAGINVICCVGESEQERLSGDTIERINQQLSPVCDVLQQQYPSDNRIAVAYEPIWAIGTGKRASLDDINPVHQAIASKITADVGQRVQVDLLYGGSVNSGNAAELFASDWVHGALVGGASLDPEALMQIVGAFCQTKGISSCIN